MWPRLLTFRFDFYLSLQKIFRLMLQIKSLAHNRKVLRIRIYVNRSWYIFLSNFILATSFFFLNTAFVLTISKNKGLHFVSILFINDSNRRIWELCKIKVMSAYNRSFILNCICVLHSSLYTACIVFEDVYMEGMEN